MSAPWMKFYPRDWRGDQSLRAVSIGARGLWMECLCIMHEARPYGHLVLNGDPVDDDTLARMAGVSVDEVSAFMAELRKAGAYSVTSKGVIFSRRMTKDHARAGKGRKAVQKRWAQQPERQDESGVPNRSSNRIPTTQKPEARSQNPPIPPVGGKGEDEALFDEIWRAFPKHDTSNPKSARNQYNMLTPQERGRLLDAAQRYRRWWQADCRKRGQSETDRLTYVPHLSKWIQSGAWEHADDLPAIGAEPKKAEGFESLDRYADEALFAKCERLMGKPVPTSMQRYSFPADIIQKAQHTGRAA